MKRLLRAIAHGLQRLSALLLRYASARQPAPPGPPQRPGESPPADWLRRSQPAPPRDWIERVRRGRARWMEGTTPSDAAASAPPPQPATPAPPPPARVARGRAPGGAALAPGGARSRGPAPDPGAQPASPAPALALALDAAAPPDDPPASVAAPADDSEPGRRQALETPRHRSWLDRVRRPPAAVSESAGLKARAPAAPRDGSPAPAERRGGGSRVASSSEVPREVGAGRALPVLEPAPRLRIVPQPIPLEPQRQAISEIDELPAEDGLRDPWPELPDDPPTETPEPTSIWRGWERRQRLAREQRGD